MLSDLSPVLLQPNIKVLFERLFLAPESAIENAPAHQIRLWLEKVRVELIRERNKGTMQHYRYDMNKHIALAAARNALAMQLEKLERK